MNGAWLRWLHLIEEATLNISKPIKFLLLALTLWIPLYMVGFIAMVFTGRVPESFDAVFRIHVATMGIQALLLLVYIVHLFKTDHVERHSKALWGITLFCASPIAMPIYWFTHLWPDRMHVGINRSA
jgi:hypothetical protein